MSKQLVDRQVTVISGTGNNNKVNQVFLDLTCINMKRHGFPCLFLAYVSRCCYTIQNGRKAMINTILFDLDGTLLPMDEKKFTALYFEALTTKFQPYGLNPELLVKSVWLGTKAMIDNDGAKSNESRFWDTFSAFNLGKRETLEPLFTDFYEHQFEVVKNSTWTNPLAKQIIDLLHDKGYMTVLATNPLFPRVATHKRIVWAGLKIKDFALITTYENSNFTKPNAEYYKMVLHTINRVPEECLMIGNDIEDDMAAAVIGIETYLLTDCLMSHCNENIDSFNHGSFSELEAFLSDLPHLEK